MLRPAHADDRGGLIKHVRREIPESEHASAQPSHAQRVAPTMTDRRRSNATLSGLLAFLSWSSVVGVSGLKAKSSRESNNRAVAGITELCDGRAGWSLIFGWECVAEDSQGQREHAMEAGLLAT
jgi:hypothetical protein